MTEDRLIIIGGGIAGLATACYARMNGYEVDLFEMHRLPGGDCTSWKRKGYTFDYCIHNLSGSSSASDVNTVWKELGALEGIRIIDHDRFVTVEGPSGEKFEWWTDTDRLAAHMKELSPGDGQVIDELVRNIRKFIGVDPFAASMGGFWRTAKMIPKLSLINRWSELKLGDFGSRFTDAFLRRAFGHVMYDMSEDDVPMIAVMVFMSGLAAGDLGWPVGGSLAFSRRIEKRLKLLGGEVTYKTRVESIIVENDRAVGVRLADGTQRRGSRVICAADGHSAIFDMLDGRYVTDTIHKYYDDFSDDGPFGFIMFLGLDGQDTGAPHALTLLFDEPLDMGGNVEQDSLHIVSYGPQTGLCNEGKSILKIEAQASYSFWKQLRDRDRDEYNAEKSRVAERILDRIAPRFPKIRERIVVMDTSTLATCERYTGNFRGAQPGPCQFDRKKVQREGLSRTLPGLAGFHMVSHWATTTIGVSTVAIEGRNLVRRLCKEDGRKFRVTDP